MTDEFWIETSRMLGAGGIVAAVAVPLMLIAGAVLLRHGISLVPLRKPWRVPWGGVEVLVAFVLMIEVPSLLQYGGIPLDVAGLLAVPMLLAFFLVAGWQLYPGWSPFRGGMSEFASLELPRSQRFGLWFCRVLTLGILAWLVLTPVVHLVNGLVTILFTHFDLPMEPHPLTKMAAGPASEQFLFLLEACLAAPIIEEILFRGLLLPWMIGARERNIRREQLRPIAPAKVRPLLVMAMGVIFAASSGKLGPVVYAGVLALGLVVLWFGVRRGQQHIRAIYASAALFGLVHSGVWPSPIPLFALGLGLGWIAVRSRGVLVPIIVHGLFNAVSAVYVLRGAT